MITDSNPNWSELEILETGEFELMFTNTEVYKMVRISKTNQDNPDMNCLVSVEVIQISSL